MKPNLCNESSPLHARRLSGANGVAGGSQESVTERLASGIDCYRAVNARNHSNIGDGGVARDVLMSITQFERLDGDMAP